jgi:hypothetical protein
MDEKAALIGRAQELARALGRDTLTRAEFARRTGIGAGKVHYHFGGWSAFCRAAGLTPNRARGVPIPDDALFAALRDALLAMGGVGTQQALDKHFRYGVPILRRRGWRWRTALQRLRQWCEKNDPGFPYLDQLPAEPPGPELRRIRKTGGGAGGKVSPKSGAVQSARRIRQPVYGDRLGFRNFVNAPVSEINVAMLFALVSDELGFEIERAGPGYPDCDARRRAGPGRWQRVRIEFEFLARNFELHGHDPEHCDLIVCWEDNRGLACPVEVLAVKPLIARLMERG